MSMYEIGILKRMRSFAITRKIPTPIATVNIRTRLGMAETWPASTCKSGSATVMITPKIKQTAIESQTFLVRESSTPMPSPMGIMDISTPKVKKPMPTIRSTAPNKNSVSVPGVSGAMEILKTSTINVIGSTEVTDS